MFHLILTASYMVGTTALKFSLFLIFLFIYFLFLFQVDAFRGIHCTNSQTICQTLPVANTTKNTPTYTKRKF